ncbi:MAG: DUF1700 domain-containing protein [Ruminococcus sp.]|jgi:uncharacterized membrane protein
MNRKEFMEQLERLLADIPDGDREDAIAYYNDYFDEAGEEHEAEIIQELGSPGKVAATIMAGMGRDDSRGEYTEQGYQDSRFKERIHVPADKERQERQKRGRSGWVLIIILLIFASPMLLGIGGGILGIFLGIAGALLGVIAAAFAAGIGCLAGGVANVAVGIGRCFSDPGAGLMMMGSGMISAAIGILFAVLFLWVIFGILPGVFRIVINWCSRVLHRGKGGRAHEENV